MKSLELVRLGVVPYGQALAYQLEVRERLRESSDLLGQVLLLEHPPTVTLGKRGTQEHLVNPAYLQAKGVQVFTVDRGGEATYHGPGQLVVYPILRLSNLGLGVVDIVRGLAACLADVAKDYGVDCAYDVDHPGVWTTEPRKKLASVGMRVSRGVSTHGAAINLVNDMAPFGWIIPCGIPDAPMMRLADAADVDVAAFSQTFLERFGELLGVSWDPISVALPSEVDWIAPDIVSTPLD